METVAAPGEVVHASRSVGAREEIRCPSCARLLVLRSGPAITAHYAHRPRQSCRKRPGSSAVTPLRLEQLALFELEALPAPGSARAVDDLDESPTKPARPVRRTRRHRRRRRALQTASFAKRAADDPRLRTGQPTTEATSRISRRRKAWLPRLIRWLRAQAAA